MRILAFDTSLSDISVAVQTLDGVFHSSSFQHERNALQKLAGLVQDVLAEAGTSITDINLVVCTKGPGSFTGLRVGVAAARAFADSVGAKMVGISTLELLASDIDPDESRLIVPIVECIREELYTGFYRWEDGDLVSYQTDECLILADLQQRLSELPPHVLIGPGLVKYGDSLQGDRQEGFNTPNIETLIKLASLRSGDAVEPLDFLPEYLRLSQPELRAAAGVSKEGTYK